MAQVSKSQYGKLLAAYAIPVVLSIVSAVAVFSTVKQVTQQSAETQTGQLAVSEMNEMAYGLSRMVRNVRGQILFPQDTTYLTSYKEGLESFQKSAQALKDSVQNPQQRQALLQMIEEGEKHDHIAQEIFALMQQGQTARATEQTKLMRMSEIDRHYNSFLQRQEQLLAAHSQHLKTSLFNLNLLVLLSTLVSGLSTACVGLLIKKRFEQAVLLARHTDELSEKHQALQATQAELTQSLNELKRTQSQLVQAEKMSSLGQLVAGVAHEINNPVNFIHGNLTHVEEYSQSLIEFIQLYQKYYPTPVKAIQQQADEIDLEFLQEDLPKLMDSMKLGTQRIRQIVLSLRNFSRLDEADFKAVDIHEGIDSTLLILQYRLKARADRPEIQVIREYGNLPLIECYPGQLNQVFMNILANAIDALEEAESKNAKNPPMISIRTNVLDAKWVQITIADNGVGIPKEVQQRIFNPFFTTKPVGKGTGMGMSISHQIITEKHGGKMECLSAVGKGAEFILQIPVQQQVPVAV